MPLSNFGEVRSSIRDWAKRSSLGDALITDFVALCEAVFNHGDAGNDVKPLRVRDMETMATVTVTDGSGPLPTDFLEAVKVTDPGGITRNIQYAPAEWLDENFPSGQDGTFPGFYTIIGSTLYCPISVSLTYYAKIPTITASDDDANWLLTKAPNAYLYGGLMQYAIWDKNAEQAGGFRAMMTAALAGLNAADINSRAGQMTRRSSMVAY